MKAVILKCPTHNMFRLGKNSLDTTDTIIHSDTLFSAIVINYLKLYGEHNTTLPLKTFIELFREGKVKISSAFHCLEKVEQIGDKEKSTYLYFLPKPDAYNLQTSDDDHKATKKIAFLSRESWKQNPFKTQYSHIIGGTHAITESEAQKMGLNRLKGGKELTDISLVKTVFMPKVVVHKATQDDSYYSVSNVQLPSLQLADRQQRAVHFYFLMDTNGLNELEEKRLKACIRLLEDEGIGGERSVGCGRIKEVVFINDWKMPKGNFNATATLSLTVPVDDAEFQHYSYYKLVKRGGNAIGKNAPTRFKRKQLTMVKEGAILEQAVEGKVVDISSNGNGSILRNGKALTIGAFMPN